VNADTRVRLARLLLAAAAAAVVVGGLRAAPTDQTLILAVEGDRSRVREIRGVLLRGDEELSGFERRYETGAPNHVSYATRVPNGSYRLVVTVVPDTAAGSTTTKHSVELAGNAVRVFIR